MRLTTLALGLVCGCASSGRSDTTEAEQVGPGCRPTLATDELPSWFDAGSTPRGIVGVRRSAVAIPFVSELKVNSADERKKVLIELETRTTNGRLQITGSLGEVTVDISRQEVSEHESSFPGYLECAFARMLALRSEMGHRRGHLLPALRLTPHQTANPTCARSAGPDLPSEFYVTTKGRVWSMS